MDKKPYTDISLSKNQNTIAVLLSTIFSLKELEELIVEFRKIKNYKKENNDIINIMINKEFEKDRRIQLIDMICIKKESDICLNFVDLRITSKDFFQIDFKFKHSKKLYYHLIFTVVRAINYIKYKSSTDLNINRSNILNNFANELAKVASPELLEEARYQIHFINNDANILKNEENEFNFKLADIEFKIISFPEILKFEFIKNDKSKYILLEKTNIGKSYITLLIEKAIKLSLKKVKKSR